MIGELIVEIKKKLTSVQLLAIFLYCIYLLLFVK